MSIRFVPPVLLAGLLLASGLLTACQDPSAVGLELIGEEGGDPNVTVLAADSVALAPQEDVTGGFADGLSPVQTRTLVGAAMDPLLGDVEAEAYFDIRPPATVPEGFRERTILTATLRLVRDYVYGDSTASLPLALDGMAEAWTPIGAAADTSFEAGDEIATYTQTASDTLFALALPSSWVAANDALLRSDSVGNAFDGFRLRVPEGAMPGAVVGFNGTLSRLRVTTAEDTVDYPISQVFTRIERGAAPAPPPDRLFLRDGDGQTVLLTFDFDAIRSLGLANATLRLNTDPALVADGSFARSLPERLSLYGRTPEDERILILTAERSDEDTYTFTSPALTAALQEELLGDGLFARFELSVASNPVTLDVLPLVLGPAPLPGEVNPRPRLALTVIPESD